MSWDNNINPSTSDLDTYCFTDETQTANLPPSNVKQRLFTPKPYGPFNCNMFSTLGKPGINPISLRGKTVNRPDHAVYDNDQSLEGRESPDGTKIRICNGEVCSSSAPGGLVDWMGEPKGFNRIGKTMEDSLYAQIYGASPNTGVPPQDHGYPGNYYQNNVNPDPNTWGYKDPLGDITKPQLMKNGFVFKECDNIDDNLYSQIERYGHIKPQIITKPEEININDYCEKNIEAYAKTCAWCQSAEFTVPNLVNHGKTPTVDDALINRSNNNYCFCRNSGGTAGAGPGFVDVGDCFGLGANGIPRINCDCNTNTCETDITKRKWKPNDTGDCKICDSDFWKWVPGGYQALLDGQEANPYYKIAKSIYISSDQRVDPNKTVSGFSCNQPTQNDLSGTIAVAAPPECIADPSNPDNLINKSGISGYCQKPSVNFCGRGQIRNPFGGIRWNFPQNQCDQLCSECAVMNWDGPITENFSNEIVTQNIITNLTTENGFSPINQQPNTSCSQGTPLNDNRDKTRKICKRNPGVTLRGTSHEENKRLVDHWLNGRIEVQGPLSNGEVINDPSATQEILIERHIQAMRCCLNQQPGYKYTDENGNKKSGPGNDVLNGIERWARVDCPSGVVCPSSDTCKDLFRGVMEGTNRVLKMDLNDFGNISYPQGFTLDGNASENISKSVLENPAWYAKSYCELMSGGKELNGPGVDEEINTLCRKTMYNYCTSPVEVAVKNSEKHKYAFDKYTLPLNIFSEGCYKWFHGDLDKALPSDYGTRDMALGSTCQQLQQEGWVDPGAPGNSPLLSAFMDDLEPIHGENPKGFTDTSGRVIKINFSPHTGVDGSANNIKRTCSCFYTGSQCNGDDQGGQNCSYYYCGAGTNFDPTNANSIEAFGNLNKTVDLNPYIEDNSWSNYQGKIAPVWKQGIDSNNFTCVKRGNLPNDTVPAREDNMSNGWSSCYTNCNYTNSYDVCWNASPEERKFSTELENWDCDPNDPSGNSCTRYKEGVYGCFGPCPIGVDGIPNCGTEDWFKAPTGNRKQVTPKEGSTQFKSDTNILEGADYPYWQNYYSSGNKLFQATVPGFGSISGGNSGRAANINCNEIWSIKPYGLTFEKPSNCEIKQSTTVNNNGNIVGSINISQMASCKANAGFARKLTDTDERHDFLQYMGSKTCDGSGCDAADINFCIDKQSGDNCMVCNTDKSTTCCTSPNLIESQWANSNTDIINKVGSNVSYICWQNSCPEGTTDLGSLEATCSKTCSSMISQEECDTCEYCQWIKEYDTNNNPTGSYYCKAFCPGAPQAGWGNYTPPPTEAPVSSEEPSSQTIPISMNLEAIIGGSVGGFVVLAGIIGLGVYFGTRTKPTNQLKNK